MDLQEIHQQIFIKITQSTNSHVRKYLELVIIELPENLKGVYKWQQEFMREVQ